MTPEALAELSARAYRHMQPWTPEDFRATLAQPHVVLTTTDHAFVLGQIVLDEAEILALAADPDHQRRGQASAALRGFVAIARNRGVTRVVLEVSAENTPAIRFYIAAGFVTQGRRKAYYRLAGGQTADALLMSRALG